MSPVVARIIDNDNHWRWYCDDCDQRSFATFPNIDQAIKALERHQTPGLGYCKAQKVAPEVML